MVLKWLRLKWKIKLEIESGRTAEEKFLWEDGTQVA
jgi:hypothetical protein